MDSIEIAAPIVANYVRHGWQLRQVLTRSISASDVRAEAIFGDAPFVESDFDALWFARPSHQGREAWELRLVAEQAYALFEAFEAEEAEPDRLEARKEMENKMREYANR